MSDATAREAVSDPWLTSFCDALLERADGTAEAVLLYGSYLRGKRDTVLDFYLLVRDLTAVNGVFARLGNRLLAPNVYNLVVTREGKSRMAKFAVVCTEQFLDAIAHDFHPYFWGRFVQPCVILFAADQATGERLRNITRVAGRRTLAATLPMMPATFTTAEFWERAFALTYRCELRSERSEKRRELVVAYVEHLSEITTALADEFGLVPDSSARWRHAVSRKDRFISKTLWGFRASLGKLLSVLRLLKAAFTFNEPLDYILWKIERHSGVRVEASPLQRRYPLLFAWPVLWRLYRRGGFR